MSDIKQKVDGNQNITAGGNIYIDDIGKFLENKPTILGKYIAQLSKKIVDPSDQDLLNYDDYAIKDKIKYNNVIEFKPLIDEYGIFGSQVEKVCESLNVDTPNIKLKLFNFINSEYLKIKGKYFKKEGSESQDVINKYSDDIIKDVISALVILIESDNNISDFDREDLILCINMLVIKSFIDCRILEKPLKNKLC